MKTKKTGYGEEIKKESSFGLCCQAYQFPFVILLYLVIYGLYIGGFPTQTRSVIHDLKINFPG